jgi:hypothetical protein
MGELLSGIPPGRRGRRLMVTGLPPDCLGQFGSSIVVKVPWLSANACSVKLLT